VSASSINRKEQVMSTSITSWFPLFEFQDWTYQAFLLLPTPLEDAAAAGGAVSARKWSRGDLMCGQAFAATDGYTLSGTLVFAEDLQLDVVASGTSGRGTAPGTFLATGTGTSGKLKGMVSELTGWVFPELPSSSDSAARVLSVRGSIRAVRGTDTDPEHDPSGLPLGTVGAFVISRTVA
jgi:hypothetical protein